MDEDNEASEDLKDPDYPLTAEDARQKTPSKLTDEKRCDAIRRIVRSEFTKEIRNKEKDLAVVDERLLLARKSIQLLRYAIVKRYYNSKEFQLTEDDIHKEVVDQKDPVARAKVQSMLKAEQKNIHPAIKKLLGKHRTTEDLEELFNIRPARKRNKLNTACTASTSSQDITIKADECVETLRAPVKLEQKEGGASLPAGELKVPRYIQPLGLERHVLKVDPACRNQHKHKFRIIIGNTSKYSAPHSRQDRSTHRWLLYVRGPRSAPDVSHLLASVTVRLHDSYAPHNILTIKSPPFHVSRRGWGEFPVRLRLHFHNAQHNKPVDLAHELRLDRNYTGVETLGAETLVDVWLYTDETMRQKQQAIEAVPQQEQNKNKTTDPEPSLLSKPKESNTEDSVLNADFSALSQQNNDQEPKLETLENNEEMPQNACENVKDVTIINCNDAALTNDLNSFDLNKVKNETVTIDVNETKNNCLRIVNETNECSIKREMKEELLEHVNYNVKVVKVVKKKQESLLKPEVKKMAIDGRKEMKNVDRCEYLNAFWRVFKNDHCYVNDAYLTSVLDDDLTHVKSEYFDVIKLVNKTVLGRNLDSVERLKSNDEAAVARQKVGDLLDVLKLGVARVGDVRLAVELMLRRMPLVDPLAHTREYQRWFPYAVKSAEAFYALNTVKRRNLEWTRAKVISNFLKKHFAPNNVAKVWSVKQILLFSHYHGYYPVDVQRSVHLHPNKYINLFKNSTYNHDEEKTRKEMMELKENFENVNQIDTKTNAKTVVERFLKIDSVAVVKNEFSLSKSDVFCTVSDDDDDDEIDVCNVDTVGNSRLKKDSCNGDDGVEREDCLPFASDDEKLQCYYIEKKCQQIGIELRNESVGSGYHHSLAHKVMLSAMSSFVEDILRRSLAVKMDAIDRKMAAADVSTGNKLGGAHSSRAGIKRPVWNKTEEGRQLTVSVRQVYEAVNTRQEFDVITNDGLGAELMEYNEKI